MTGMGQNQDSNPSLPDGDRRKQLVVSSRVKTVEGVVFWGKSGSRHTRGLLGCKTRIIQCMLMGVQLFLKSIPFIAFLSILDAKIMGFSKFYMTASVMVRNNNTSQDQSGFQEDYGLTFQCYCQNLSRSCERKVSLQPAAMICSQSLCYNHRPIKRQPQLVSMSTRTPQNTWLRVAESTREGNKEAEACVDQVWARHPPAGTACLANPSHYRGICFGRRRAEAWSPSGPPLCSAIRVVLLTTDTSGLKSMCSAVRKNCFGFPALPFISQVSLDIISIKVGLRYLCRSSVTSYQPYNQQYCSTGC